MPDSLSTLLGQIAEELEQRHSRGEKPTAEEFLARHPEHAGTLKGVLPLLMELQGVSALGSSTYPAIPGYTILGTIGQGGMGVVYEVRQEALGRVVAMKCLLPGLIAGPLAVQRFLNEAAMAARLQHANIVTVHALGEHNGQPYLIMERIVGPDLRQYLAGQPQQARWSAQIIRRLALAVQHAHDQGVIHRDLKPSNVLLDAAGQPHLSDFGLARLLDKNSELTGTGTIVGSPSYMAPEQALGQSEVGPAADVWALGAILYECLTGRPPYLGVDRLDTLLLVRQAEPIPPGRIHPGVPRDLEIIALHCLNKEPTRRYKSAQALAEDLERFLDGRPIVARPPGILGYLVRWARRKPAIAGLSSALLLTGLLGAAALIWQVHRTNLQYQAAEQNFRTAQQAVHDCFTLVTEHPDLQGPGMQPAREVLLRSALRYYRDFLTMRQDDPSLREELAGVYYRIGVIFAELGSSTEACTALGQALDLALHPRDKARSRHQLGSLYLRLEQMTQAEESLLAALQLRTDLQQTAEDRLDLAETLAKLGQLYRSTARIALAETHLRRALELGRSTQQVRLAQVHMLLDLSQILDETKKVKENLQTIQEAIRLARALVQQEPDRADYLDGLGRSHRLHGAYLLMHGGTAEQTRAAYAQALPFIERLTQEHPRVVRYQVNLISLLMDLGLANTLHTPPRTEEALACFDRGRKVCDQLLARYPDEPLYLSMLGALQHKKALLQGRMRQYAQAEASHREALLIHRRRRQLLPQSNQVRVELVNSLLMLAQYTSRHDLPECLALFAEAEKTLDEIQQTQSHFSRLDWLRGMVFSGRATALTEHGQYVQALNDWKRSLLTGNEASHLTYRLRGLACQAALGQYEDATREAEKCLAGLRKEGSKNYHEAVLWFHGARVFAQAAAGANKDKTLPPVQQQERVRRYAARCLQILAIAQRLGVFDRATHIDDLREEQDFAGLRGHEDFKGFLSSLDGPQLR